MAEESKHENESQDESIELFLDLLKLSDEAFAHSVYEKLPEGYDVAYDKYLTTLGNRALPTDYRNCDLAQLVVGALSSQGRSELVKQLKRALKLKGVCGRDFLEILHRTTTPVDVAVATRLVTSWLEKNNPERPPDWMMHALLQIGFLLGRKQSLPELLSSKFNSISASKRRKGKGALTDIERKLVFDFIAAKSGEGISVKRACEQAGSQLRTGEFDGITRSVEIEDETIRSQWNNRKKIGGN